LVPHKKREQQGGKGKWDLRGMDQFGKVWKEGGCVVKLTRNGGEVEREESSGGSDHANSPAGPHPKKKKETETLHKECGEETRELDEKVHKIRRGGATRIGRRTLGGIT